MKEKDNQSLIEAINKLENTLEKFLKGSFQEIYSPPKIFLYNFISGFLRGLGFALGISFTFTFIFWLISQLQVIPSIGNWIIKLLEYIKSTGGF